MSIFFKRNMSNCNSKYCNRRLPITISSISKHLPQKPENHTKTKKNTPNTTTGPWCATPHTPTPRTARPSRDWTLPNEQTERASRTCKPRRCLGLCQDFGQCREFEKSPIRHSRTGYNKNCQKFATVAERGCCSSIFLSNTERYPTQF